MKVNLLSFSSFWICKISSVAFSSCQMFSFSVSHGDSIGSSWVSKSIGVGRTGFDCSIYLMSIVISATGSIGQSPIGIKGILYSPDSNLGGQSILKSPIIFRLWGGFGGTDFISASTC